MINKIIGLKFSTAMYVANIFIMLEKQNVVSSNRSRKKFAKTVSDT